MPGSHALSHCRQTKTDAKDFLPSCGNECRGGSILKATFHIDAETATSVVRARITSSDERHI